MKSTTFAAAALFAASSATAATTCPAINILEACLETTQGYLTLCPTTTDYQCLCDKWTAIVSCFDNCPTDSRASSFGNNKTLYCMNASVFATTSTAAVAKPTASQSGNSNAVQTTDSAAVQSASASASSSTGAPKPTGTGAAANLAVSVGGILAAVAGVVAAVL